MLATAPVQPAQAARPQPVQAVTVAEFTIVTLGRARLSAQQMSTRLAARRRAERATPRARRAKALQPTASLVIQPPPIRSSRTIRALRLAQRATTRTAAAGANSVPALVATALELPAPTASHAHLALRIRKAASASAPVGTACMQMPTLSASPATLDVPHATVPHRQAAPAAHPRLHTSTAVSASERVPSRTMRPLRARALRAMPLASRATLPVPAAAQAALQTSRISRQARAARANASRATKRRPQRALRSTSA